MLLNREEKQELQQSAHNLHLVQMVSQRRKKGKNQTQVYLKAMGGSGSIHTVSIGTAERVRSYTVVFSEEKKRRKSTSAISY